MTIQEHKTGEVRIALNEVVFQIPCLTKSIFCELLGAATSVRESDRLIRRLCKQHIIECRIQNAVILDQLIPLRRPSQVSNEFLSQVKERAEMQMFRVAKPVVFVRASRLMTGLIGRDYSHDLSFDALNATLRLGDGIRWNANEYGRTFAWDFHKRDRENKLPAQIASFNVPNSIRRRYCVAPLPLGFRSVVDLIQNLHRSGGDYEIW